ncbi:MAG: HlyD family efflux transporter periplasmic adaptor subunit [Methylobacter sp.]|nr:HlyD family efflux transporter periplasmic adaptor subunit [Methylobacter sp.]
MVFINKKQRLIVLIPIVILIVGAIILLSRGLIPQAINIKDCVIITIDQGYVYEPVVASGTVEAENEVLIRYPYPSLIKQIIKEPGSRVQKGDVILVLDDEPIKDEISKINDQLELKRNNLEKNKLSEFSTNVDLNYSDEVKKLTITSLKSQLADELQLLDVGGISPAKIEKTKQELALAEKDLTMLKQKNGIRLKQLKAEEQGLILGIKIQEKDLAYKVNVLSMMHITAPSSGIILSISNKVGENINAEVTTSSVLIRMSDLSTFKILGSAEDKYANLIKTGRKVFAVIDSERLPGIIGNVTPVVENNKIQFNVHLEQKNHPKLIANQQIVLWIVAAEKEQTVRLKNLNIFNKEIPGVVYVLNNDKAVRREITTGIKNSDFIQVLSGLDVGEKVIIPRHGMGAFRNAKSVVINN